MPCELVLISSLLPLCAATALASSTAAFGSLPIPLLCFPPDHGEQEQGPCCLRQPLLDLCCRRLLLQTHSVLDMNLQGLCCHRQPLRDFCCHRQLLQEHSVHDMNLHGPCCLWQPLLDFCCHRQLMQEHPVRDLNLQGPCCQRQPLLALCRHRQLLQTHSVHDVNLQGPCCHRQQLLDVCCRRQLLQEHSAHDMNLQGPCCQRQPLLALCCHRQLLQSHYMNLNFDDATFTVKFVNLLALSTTVVANLAAEGSCKIMMVNLHVLCATLVAKFAAEGSCKVNLAPKELDEKDACLHLPASGFHYFRRPCLSAAVAAGSLAESIPNLTAAGSASPPQHDCCLMQHNRSACTERREQT